MLKVKQLHSDSKIPTRAYSTDSGLDLYAYLPNGDIALYLNTPVVVPTGIAVELPQDKTVITDIDNTKYTLVKEAQIRGTFELASKGISAHWGTVCNSYAGELKVILTNLGSDRFFTISHNMRIARLVIQTVLIPELEIVQELADTYRSKNGFGSTGR